MFKTLDLKSLSIGVLIAMVVVTFMLLATTNNTPTQWEYKTMTLVGQSGHEANLNGLGKDGWEVVGFATLQASRTESEYRSYVLKRPKVYSNKPRWKFW
jgi:hypothetical protein